MELHGQWQAALIELHYPNTIQHVIQGENDSRQHLVHWRGYPEKSRSWIFDSDILKDGQNEWNSTANGRRP